MAPKVGNFHRNGYFTFDNKNKRNSIFRTVICLNLQFISSEEENEKIRKCKDLKKVNKDFTSNIRIDTK